jgi:RNA polymerase sigma factor (TIGR02999 family)
MTQLGDSQAIGAPPDHQTSEELLGLVYRDLRSLAAQRLSREPSGQTLQATALVHEVYLRLTSNSKVQHWNGKHHFFGAAAEAMRRILIERARRRASQKAGGNFSRVPLTDTTAAESLAPEELLDLDVALQKLEKVDPRKARIVQLRFFVGLTNEEAADVLGISVSTAENDWAYARCWLRVEMSQVGSVRGGRWSDSEAL